PEQIRLLPVTDEVLGYAEELQNQLKAAGIRASIDRSGDRLGKLIRTGEQMKIPVLAVIGAKEAEQGAASLRSRRDGDLGVITRELLVTTAQSANQERLASLCFADSGSIGE
ncbi:MAG: His/Gly/Thr/Pro-type tRNA ligase C-terminal domain-containing protein, partial [Synechococcus sp. cluster2_bin.235]|nr:His/Gly/Thr/Pro-type tRNA ligase C-terminal domain-containing protein [Synechococcus sp. cluster2_bin.235]